MNCSVTYKEEKRPVESVILTLTEEEAFQLSVLFGRIRGGGTLRTLTNNIYHALPDSDLQSRRYKEFCKENKDISINLN